MKWFDNIRIQSKLILSFGIVIILTVILAFQSINTAESIDAEYSYLLEYPQRRLSVLSNIRVDFITMRRLAVTSVLETGRADAAKSFINQFLDAYDRACQDIDHYLDLNDNDPRRDSATKENFRKEMEKLEGLLTKYKTDIMEPAAELVLSNNLIDARSILSDGGTILNDAAEIVDSISEIAETAVNNSSAGATENKNSAIIIFIILAAVIVIASIIISIFVSRTLTLPIKRLSDIMNDLVKGKLDINKIQTSKDEIGQLTHSTFVLADIILLLIKKMDDMSKTFRDGDIDAKIDTSLFSGSYRMVAEGVNSMAGSIIKESWLFMDCISKFGDGNFDADIPKLPGKKAAMNENLDKMRKNLKDILGDISFLVRDASKGKLSSRVDSKKYKGDWVGLLDGLNQLMEEIAAPINEAVDVLQHVSNGNFDHKLEGNYQGDFQLIKNSINGTVTNVSSYINEISEVLSAMSEDNDLNQEITREYVGRFSEIKAALNNIIYKFNKIIADILTAADQVASGSKQISESSMMLAQGASVQAASTEELNATIMTINDSTSGNALNAKVAEDLAAESQKNAELGDRNMKDMLASMDGINDSSNNIAKIIKVIDDIAFQTNLLALNAAVESARAGVHGKGFAVVAEEVRNLAGRSQNAARETSSLIEESINKVNDGTRIAATTAEAFRTIVSDVAKVHGIITKISATSNEQAESINHFTVGLSQITDVVQNNSSTSEESASASEELSSQAEMLRALVSVFNLKKDTFLS